MAPTFPFNDALALKGKVIHLWTVDLDADARTLDRCRRLLSPAEEARADRYRSQQLTDRFIASRGLLRVFLGSYLAQSAQAIEFAFGTAGKPCLVEPASDLQFNISESQGAALFGFTTGCELGVDIERVRPLEEMPRLVEQFFHVDEARDFFSLPEQDREKAFFACWTRKEAYIKALGGGLSVPLNSFRVTLRPAEPAQLCPPCDEWTLQAVTHVGGYEGAIAYHDRCRRLHVWPLAGTAELLERFA